MRLGELTEKQYWVLKYIHQQIRTAGRPPTQREIRDQFGYAHASGAQRHLGALERKGYINRTGAHRGLELVWAKVWPLFGIPLYGRVVAGKPALAEENIEYTFTPQDLYPEGEDVFALRVEGDSMVDEGIREGDIVLVRRQREAAPGDIVVAIKDDEATVKRYARRNGREYLEPANPAYEKLSVDGWRIVGVVIQLVRRLKR